MAAYVPGEQPPAGVKVIKLNTNENPYPPSPRAIEAAREFDPDSLRRYPHPFAQPFLVAAAKALDVPADWIVAGNGSDDLLAMIVLACAEPGRKVVYPMPTYVLYRTLAEMQDAQCVEVPSRSSPRRTVHPARLPPASSWTGLPGGSTGCW
jgi:histidinol-phosphate aminotransferase